MLVYENIIINLYVKPATYDDFTMGLIVSPNIYSIYSIYSIYLYC